MGVQDAYGPAGSPQDAMITVLIVGNQRAQAVELAAQVETVLPARVTFAPGGAAALAAIAAGRPDCVLIDVDLDGSPDGIEVASRLPADWPTAVVFVTARTDSAMLARVSAVRHAGFLVRPVRPADLVAALKLALLRARYPASATAAAGVERRDDARACRLDAMRRRFELTGAETRIVEQLLGGRHVHAISTRLGRSVNTVRTHIRRIYAKIGVHSQVELLALLMDRRTSAPDSESVAAPARRADTPDA